jgi:hypothetical protein
MCAFAASDFQFAPKHFTFELEEKSWERFGKDNYPM